LKLLATNPIQKSRDNQLVMGLHGVNEIKIDCAVKIGAEIVNETYIIIHLSKFILKMILHFSNDISRGWSEVMFAERFIFRHVVPKLELGTINSWKQMCVSNGNQTPKGTSRKRKSRRPTYLSGLRGTSSSSSSASVPAVVPLPA
jgi:hypothetical protein